MRRCASIYYGLPSDPTVDGAYARSIIVDELASAQQIWAVRPLNREWLGPCRATSPRSDLQTELWMNASYREQVRANRLIGRLGDAGRAELSKDDDEDRDHHPVDLQEVELQRQRDSGPTSSRTSSSSTQPGCSPTPG